MTEPTPAGWYPEGSTGSLRYWDGTAWTEHRKPADATVPAPVSSWEGFSGADDLEVSSRYGLVSEPGEIRGGVPDPGFIHLLRYLVIYAVMIMTCYLLIGFVWLAIALSQTGRRKRDLLMLLIPIWNTFVMVQTIWRYTAKNVYWSVRSDRASKSLFASV